MGIAFLAPIFLAGAAAIAIPIIVHLTHRQRKDAIAFPSLMFLSRIPFRTHRRQRIRHWPLFLMRSLALVLLAAAFARPLVDDEGRAAATFASARELVVLLDRSHSMAYGDRWERATAEAQRVLEEVGPDDRATLVVFAEQAEAVTRATADRATLVAALSGAEVGYGVTRFGPAIRLAREIVERTDRPRSEVVLISDLQKSGWDEREAVRLPEGTDLRIVNLSQGSAVNVSVADATVTRSDKAGREQTVVAAAVVNHGPGVVEDLRVELEVDGQVLGSESVNLEPHESARLQFEPVVLPEQAVRGVVRAGNDPLVADNAFHFTIAKSEPISVLVVEPRSGRGDHNLYLRRALELGKQPGFRVEERRVSQLETSDFDGPTVVILNDVAFPSGVVGRRLGEFVESGGGLLVLLGRRSQAGGWPAEGLVLMPVAFEGTIDRSAKGGGTLSDISYDHPALDLFRAPRSGDFSSARFFRYHRAQLRDSARALASFDDGTTALAEVRRADGIVMTWTSGLENYWNDLTLQPVFLPLVHELVEYLAGYVKPRSWFSVGDVVDLSDAGVVGTAALAAGTQLVIEQPSGKRSLLRFGQDPPYFGLQEPGFHEVRTAGGAGGLRLTAATNLSAIESDLVALDSDEVVGALTPHGEAAAASLEAVALSAEDRERRQGLWWYLLVAVGVLLVGETYVANRISRAGG